MSSRADPAGKGRFGAALAALQTALDRPRPDEAALVSALYAVSDARPHDLTADQLRAVFALNYRILGIGPEGAAPLAHLTDQGRRRLAWTARNVLESTMTDPGARHRAFVQGTLNHAAAMGRPPPPGAPTEPVPRPHIPLEKAAAAALARPYFDAAEAQMDVAPFAHLKFCWQARDFPLTPFDAVIDDWLDDMDRRGVGTGNSRLTLDRAFALATLAREGRQRMTWATCEAQLLPQLVDPHPMVAGCAGYFLGMLYSDPDEMFLGSTYAPMASILQHLAGLERHRRQAAGGFLNGINTDSGDVFADLRGHDGLAGFDVEGWTRAILSQDKAEPYLPGSQAFWFYVHESYCTNAAFIDSLIDMDRPWEALMCATKVHDRVDGLQPVLERLAALPDDEIAAPARACLARFYGAV